MKINRHNYEEWFMLYTDKELNEADCREVEAFVLVHPDLAEELEMLQQTRLEPDTSIGFSMKDSLLRAEATGNINDANYQEFLLLKTDNELSAEQEIQLQAWLATRPAAVSELNAFENTRIQPEPDIVFPDKSVLYRKEEPRRIIGFRWQRIAVAASLLLAVSTAVWMASKQTAANTEEDPIAHVDSNGKDRRVVDTNKKEINGSITPKENVSTTEDVSVQPPVNLPVNRQNSATNNGATQRSTPALAVQQTPVNNDLPDGSKTNPNLQINDINVTGSEAQFASAGISELKMPAVDYLTNPKQINEVAAVTPGISQPLEIMYVSNTGTAASEADMNESGKKNTLRGFLRKVTRTFEKTTNLRATDEDDRLLIGGLAIQL